MAQMLTVKTHPDQAKAGRIGLWDKNPAHPGGEVWCAGDAICEVADTAEVRQAITEKRIVEVRAAPGEQPTLSEAPAATDKPAGPRR